MSDVMLGVTPRVRRRSGAAASWVTILSLAGATLVPCETWGAELAIVARVNGEPVSVAELERMRANPLTLLQAREELGVQEPDADALDRVAMRKLVHHRLVIQEARRRNITVTEEELDDAIASLRRRFGDLASFGAWIKEQGLDEGSLFETVRADMAADRVWAALVEGVRVTDEQVQRYYDAHADELRREEVRLRIIAVRDEATAGEIVAALRKGADFGRLARQRSMGLRAAKGGDTGWVGAETLRPPLREAVATLKPGEARGPLRRGPELLIVLLEGRRPGSTRTLAEARSEIASRLLPAGRQEVVRAWLAEQEKSSSIEVFPRGRGAGRIE